MPNSNLRRMMMARQHEPALPGYAPVEFIELHGQEWLDTEIQPDLRWNYESEFASTDVTAKRCYVLGVYEPRLQFSYGNEMFAGYNFDYRIFPAPVKVDTSKHKITIVAGKFILDNTEIFKVAPSDNIIRDKLPIGGVNGKSVIKNLAKVRLYSFKITDESKSLLDAFPCVRQSDGKAGMYDRVSKRFLENKGGGNITWK